jgi:hypothetical protein
MSRFIEYISSLFVFGFSYHITRWHSCVPARAPAPVSERPCVYRMRLKSTAVLQELSFTQHDVAASHDP